MHRRFITSRARFGKFLFAGMLCAALACRLAMAAEPLPRHVVEQPALPLADALRAIARQTGTSVLFDPGLVSGRMSRAVSGRLTVAEAFSRALEGSGLVADTVGEGALVVRPAAAASSASAADAGRAAELEKIEVTGSRLRRVTAEGPAPVNVYTRDDIDRSGQPTLERFLSSLSEVSASAGEGGFGSTLGQGTVQLRGLPLGSTLVLVNGRRIEAVGSSSANFFNLNLIPLAAIERVEIVPVGSSAVYGGDALAGVVNVILKKNIDGQALTARLGSGKGTGDGSVSLATGRSSEQGSFLLLGSYSKTTPLTESERGFFTDADYRRFGGTDARVRNCTPGTVSSASGGNLPGLGASFAGIPAAAPGQRLTVADFAATAGQANLCGLFANGRGAALVHGNETLGLHGSAERRVHEGWSLFGEATFARERLDGRDIGLSLNNVEVSASNPYNPFGETVRVTEFLGPDNGTQGTTRETRFARVLAGVRGDLGGGWDAELSASSTRDRSTSRNVNVIVDAVARDAALAATSLELAINPFTTGRAASDSVLRGIWSDSVLYGNGRRDQLSGFVRGEPVALPAGPLELIVGGERGRDVYEAVIPDDSSIKNTRRTSAVYGELRAPLLRAEASSGPSWSRVALTLAARRDDYSDFGSAGTYQAGLEFRPTRSVLLRASAATSFKPPTLLQTQVADFSYPADLFGLLDPSRGGEPLASGEVIRGTNHDLGPEKGRALTLGAVWEPENGQGTRVGVSAWRVRINGLISILDPQAALDNEALFPGFIRRGPPAGDGTPGPVTSILLAEVNYGAVNTGGIDLEASYGWRTAAGHWTVGASATRTTEYQVALAPGAPAEDRLGRRSRDFWSPRWKGLLRAGLDQGAWSVGMTSRYLGSYRDAGTSDRRLGNFWIHDLAGSLDLRRLGVAPFGWTKGARLSLGLVNAFNRQPQYVEQLPYYDVTQADWRGRYTSVQLALDW